MACDPAKNHILLYALTRRLLISHGITCSTVQQSMIASCRTGSKIKAFYDESLQATHCAVSCSTGSGNSAADDYHIIFLAHISLVNKHIGEGCEQTSCNWACDRHPAVAPSAFALALDWQDGVCDARSKVTCRIDCISCGRSK